MQLDGYLLDTNAIIDVTAGSKRIGTKTRHIVSQAPNLYYSPISIAELEIKSMLGKQLPVAAIFELLAQQQFKELPLYSSHSLEISRFGQLVGHDPFDRILLSQASSENLGLITRDRKIIELNVPWVQDSGE
jgi:PIN domain nuclease of toxin-antitoxin system